jgi:leader peptidase (prepilin peptidase) / N-methyltransferase
LGSFLNVVILRVPLGESIVSPGSRCPKCRQPIRFYDNVPILSFIILGGRCRDCGAPISWRYPLIEFISACLSLGLYYKFGFTPAYLILFAFCASMLIIFWIDLDHMIIPDTISLGGLIVGVVATVFGIIPGMTWKMSVIGLMFGALVLYIPAVVYEKLRGIEGLGGGDVKLLAMIGAFCGPYGALFVLIVSSLVGSLAGILNMAFRGGSSTTPIPFGPFLASAAVLYVFAGQIIIQQFLASGLSAFM